MKRLSLTPYQLQAALFAGAILLFASSAFAGGTVDLTQVATDFLGSIKGAVTVFGCVMFAAGVVMSAAAREFSGVATGLLAFGAVVAIVGRVDSVFALVGVSGGLLL